MTFEWKESDEKYTEYESTNEVSMRAIYGIDCPECGNDLCCTEFYPDADDPAWHYECNDCNIGVTARPSKLVATAGRNDI